MSSLADANCLWFTSLPRKVTDMATITDRIDNTTRIPASHLLPAPPAPKSVKIEVSPRCNYRCGFCALRTREVQPKWDMDFGLFKRITREMREAGVEEIGLFYLGESFMNPRLLVDCIRHLKRDIGMPYVFLTSNASMSFPEAVEECMKAGLDSLKWSVNAADEKQFEKIMGVSRRLFRRALENIQAAWEVRERGGYKTGLYASSIRYDGKQQEKMEELLAERVRPWVDQHYGCRSTPWALLQRSARSNWATDPPPATRAGSAPCASRCRAGLRSPRVTSRPKEDYRPAVSTPPPTGRWAISTGSRSWKPGIRRHLWRYAPRICART